MLHNLSNHTPHDYHLHQVNYLHMNLFIYPSILHQVYSSMDAMYELNLYNNLIYLTYVLIYIIMGLTINLLLNFLNLVDIVNEMLHV
jgi:hypothetical protein